MKKSKTNINSHIVDMSNFEVIEQIKRGGFGIIYLVEDTKSKNRYAAKVNLQPELEQNKFISREIAILIRVQGPTIVPFYGFSLKDFNGHPNVTIFMKYMKNGSLQQLLEKERQSLSPHEFDNTTKQIILCGICHGMMTLHSHRVIHRDLKPDNILLDDEYRPCITDFGLSKFLDPENSRSQSMAGCGTTAYIAPEVIEGNHYSTKADVYSFGILMFELLTGERAYEDFFKKKKFTIFQLTSNVVKGQRPQSKIPIKKSFQQLIERCWAQEPRNRPTFKELFNKLSLSLEDDDEDTIESHMKDMISHEKDDYSDDEDDYSQFCLDNVDVEVLFNYVDEITEKQDSDKLAVQNLQNNELEQKLIALEKKIQKNEETIKNLQKQNNQKNDEIKKLQETDKKQQDEINLLKKQLEEIKSIISKSQPAIETTKSSTTNELIPEKPKEPETKPNPLEGVNIYRIRDKVNNDQLTEIVIPSSLTSMGPSIFSGCTSLTKVTIPSSLTVIDSFAFSDCSSLVEVILPSSIKTIDQYAFLNCSSLVEVILPSSIQTINQYAFSKCKSLSKIKIPSAITEIKESTFESCSSLVKVEIPSSVTKFGKKAFYSTSIVQLDGLCKVTTIGSYCFYGCSKLKSISIESVSSIGDWVFSYCRSLTDFIIPSSWTSIQNSQFNSCESLTKIDIPEGITSIGESVFFQCYSLAEVNLPSTLKSIRQEAFCYCKSLKKIIIPNSVESIGRSAFSLCFSLSHVEISSSLKKIDEYTFSQCKSLTTVEIPTSVVEIAKCAFDRCYSLTKVTIPDSVTSVAKDAFKECSKLDPEIRSDLKKREL